MNALDGDSSQLAAAQGYVGPHDIAYDNIQRWDREDRRSDEEVPCFAKAMQNHTREWPDRRYKDRPRTREYFFSRPVTGLSSRVCDDGSGRPSRDPAHDGDHSWRAAPRASQICCCSPSVRPIHIGSLSRRSDSDVVSDRSPCARPKRRPAGDECSGT